ncbi:MAG: uracil phosphoribosyltransferase [Thermonemataceae bacterium]
MFVFSEKNSITNQFLAELRDVNIQEDPMRFRRNLERLGELFAYEISTTFAFKTIDVTTPLGTKQVTVPKQLPVLATILRAGLPMYQGFLNIFDRAPSAFIGAYRGAHKTDNSYDIEIHYTTTPSLSDKTLILIDPMLATGKSLHLVYKRLRHFGEPAKVHVVAAIASQQGIDYIQEQIEEVQIWVGDVDETLNAKSYIIPGLGDAGDLAFGEKL